MLKKSLIILFAFCIVLFTSSICFASNMMQDMQTGLDNIGNGMENAVNGAKDAAGNAKNGMENMMRDMEGGIQGAMDNAKEDMTNFGATETTNDNSGYTAGRTSETRAISDTSAMASTGANSSFVWIVLAIAATIIVALVWYYGTQTEKRNND